MTHDNLCILGITEEQLDFDASHEMGESMSQWRLWQSLEMYGLPLVDDLAYYRTDKYDIEDSYTGNMVEVALLPQGEL